MQIASPPCVSSHCLILLATLVALCFFLKLIAPEADVSLPTVVSTLQYPGVPTSLSGGLGANGPEVHVLDRFKGSHVDHFLNSSCTRRLTMLRNNGDALSFAW